MTIVEARKWKADLLFKEYNCDSRVIPMIVILDLNISNDIDFDIFMEDKKEIMEQVVCDKIYSNLKYMLR